MILRFLERDKLIEKYICFLKTALSSKAKRQTHNSDRSVSVPANAYPEKITYIAFVGSIIPFYKEEQYVSRIP